jgi:hypothetical protein
LEGVYNHEKSSKLFLMKPFLGDCNANASQGSEEQGQAKDHSNQSMMLTKRIFNCSSLTPEV